MKLGTARLVMFAAGAIAAVLLRRAHVHASDGTLAGIMIVIAVFAVAWPRQLSPVLGFGGATTAAIYLFASVVAFDFDFDPEDVSYAHNWHVPLAAVACIVLGIAGIVVRIATRPRLVS